MTDTTDEIDLLGLLAKGVLIVKSNFVFIIASFLICTALGLVYYQFSPKIYESKMLISSDILTESYSKSLTDNLSKLIKEKNFQSLSEKLSVPADQAPNIEGIEIKSAIEKAVDLAENLKNYLVVEVRTKDNTIWPQLQNGIIGYLQNNEFVKIRVEHRKKYYNQTIEKINLELADLEILKKKIADGYLAQSSKESLVLFDPTTVNSKILELNKEKINLQNSLETVNSVQVVEGFTVFKKPASPKLSISLISGSSFGLVVVCLFIIFKSVSAIVKFSEEKLSNS